jgi:glycine cleavage system H protein
MSDIPEKLMYSDAHCWVELGDDNSARVGITEYGQQQLGMVIFVDLPDKGRIYSDIEECVKIETIDASREIYAPLTGEIIDVNFDLEENPELINVDPYGDGWIFLLRHNDKRPGDRLLDAGEYADIVSGDT